MAYEWMLLPQDLEWDMDISYCNFIQHYTEDYSQHNNQEIEIKGIQTGQEKVRWYLVTDDLIIYVGKFAGMKRKKRLIHC